MNARGMDIERVEALTNQLEFQAHAINTVVGVVDSAVSALTHLWFGDNFGVFHGSWVGGQRTQAHNAALDINDVIRTLRQQIDEQRHASGASGATTHGVTGTKPAYPTPGKVSPEDFLAFSKDSEQESSAVFKTGHEGDHIKLPDGWSPASAADLRKLGIDPKSLHDPRTGLDVSIYSNGHGGYVVSYGGSMSDTGPTGLPAQIDPTNADWREDDRVVLGIAGESAQTEQAMDLAYKLGIAAGKDNIVFTGHSLGGREAALASVVTGSRAVTFNPTGTTTEDLLYANALAGRDENVLGMLGDFVSGGAVSHASANHGSNVTNYVMTNDIARLTHMPSAVSVGQGISVPQFVVQAAQQPFHPAKEYLGDVNYIQSNGLNPADEHGLDKFDGRL